MSACGNETRRKRRRAHGSLFSGGSGRSRGAMTMALMQVEYGPRPGSPPCLRVLDVTVCSEVGNPELSPDPAALRIPATTNESVLGQTACGDVTRGGGIPSAAMWRYADRHD